MWRYVVWYILLYLFCLIWTFALDIVIFLLLLLDMHLFWQLNLHFLYRSWRTFILPSAVECDCLILLLRILLSFRQELTLLARCDSGLLCNLILKVLHPLFHCIELFIVLLICIVLCLNEVLNYPFKVGLGWLCSEFKLELSIALVWASLIWILLFLIIPPLEVWVVAPFRVLYVLEYGLFCGLKLLLSILAYSTLPSSGCS
jgi:hypothetical protein